MKFTVERDDLTAVLSMGGKLIERSTAEILSHVLLTAQDGKLAVSSANNDMSFRTSIHADIDEDGSLAIPAEKLRSWVASCSAKSTISLQTDERSAILKSGRSKATFPTLTAELWPNHVDDAASSEMTISAATMRRAIAFCLPSIGLNIGVNDYGLRIDEVDGLSVSVAFDGKRLAVFPMGISGNVKFTIPPKTISVLTAILPKEDIALEISVGARLATFRFGDISIVSKLVDGDFSERWRMAYQFAIAKSVTVDGKSLSNAVSRVYSATMDTSIGFAIQDGLMRLRSSDGSVGAAAEDEISVNGDDAGSYAVNAIFLTAALDAVLDGVTDQTVRIGFNTMAMGEPIRIIAIAAPDRFHLIAGLRAHAWTMPGFE